MTELNKDIIDNLLKNCKNQEDMFGKEGLIPSLVKLLVERALNTELTAHLGYDKHDPNGYNSGNSRNGSSEKTIKGEHGEIEINIPRDAKVRSHPNCSQRIRSA